MRVYVCVCVCVCDSSIFIGRNLIEISEARFCASPERAQATQCGMEGDMEGERRQELQRLKIGREGRKERRYSLQFHDEIYEAFDPPAQEIKIIKQRFYVCAASSPGRLSPPLPLSLSLSLAVYPSVCVRVCLCPIAAHTLSF